MKFTSPLALILLIFIPYLFWLGRPGSGTARWRDWASLGLRILIMFLLVLSLAGTQFVRAADNLAVVFLIDASDSIAAEQAAEAEAFVRQAIESMGPTEEAAVVVFGSNALVERPISGLAELAPITSVPQTLQTDIAEAIRLGLALFPAGSARRLVLLSDGASTLGDPQEAAKLAAASGVQIDIVPLERPAGSTEVLLTNVDAPTRVGEGEAFTLDISAESNVSTIGQLRVLAGGSIVHEDTVQLLPGANNFSVRLRATAQEFARYIVQLTPADDTYYQNNQLAAFTEIVGPPRVLLVTHDGTLDDAGNPILDESPQIQLALQATGLIVDKVTPAELSSSLAELSNYASIILVNINAKNLSPRKMEILQSYVRDLGGGLVAVGGPQSYGMGGYYQTPLEESLPVNMQIMDQDRFPSVSIVIVIDRSGSMGAQEGGLTKIQLAAEGAVRVVELLNDFDEITVIPVDTLPDETIGPASVTQREDIIDQIRQIGAGGGGIYVRTGLEAAAEALAQSANQVKHVIILADGADSEQKEGVPELIEALTADGTTISTVSIGIGPDVSWLQQMAELGGGRFHFTDAAANLPQIFTQETTSIQRSYLIEERFFPGLSGTSFARAHAIFRAMERAGITQVPPLFGYVGTSPKATAQVILETHMGDPLLAAWEYGLGRSVAWTSDATGRWGTEWVRWSGFPTFWSNLVRWSISQSRDSTIETAVSLTGEQARLTVDARGGGGALLNDLTMEANAVSPDGESTRIDLRQVAPGRYEGSFSPTTEGAYFVRVAGSTEDEEATIAQTTGWVLGYSPEYRRIDPNPQLLNSVAEIAGGRRHELSSVESDPGIIFEHSLPSERASRPIWPWLVALAALLLPVDVAVRRLVVTRRDISRAWMATLGRWLPQSSAVTRPGRSEQVSRLFQAKQRAGTSPAADQDLSPPPIETPHTPREQAGDAPHHQRPSDTERTSTPEPTTGSLAARLLERKRRQSEALSDDES